MLNISPVKPILLHKTYRNNIRNYHGVVFRNILYQYKVYMQFSTTVYKLCRYAKLPHSASTINPMPDCFLAALKFILK